MVLSSMFTFDDYKLTAFHFVQPRLPKMYIHAIIIIVPGVVPGLFVSSITCIHAICHFTMKL